MTRSLIYYDVISECSSVDANSNCSFYVLFTSALYQCSLSAARLQPHRYFHRKYVLLVRFLTFPVMRQCESNVLIPSFTVFCCIELPISNLHSVDPSLVVSGDDKGFVVCWFTDTNVIERYCPDGTSQMQLCCLTCSPHQANLVAVGYKSGAVSVMDITKNGMVRSTL